MKWLSAAVHSLLGLLVGPNPSSHKDLVCERDASPIHLTNGHERLYLQPWGKNAIRVRAALYQDPTQSELGGLLGKPLGSEGATSTCEQRNITYFTNARVESGNLAVTVRQNRLSFWRIGNGTESLLLQELWPQVTIVPELAESNPNSSSQHGQLSRSWSYDQAGISSRPSASFSFTTDLDEQIFGLGQHQTGVLNNKGW